MGFRVFFIPSLGLQKAKTKAERKREKQARLHGEIDAAKQTSPASDAVGNCAPRQPLVLPPMAAKPPYVLPLPLCSVLCSSLAPLLPLSLTLATCTSPGDAFRPAYKAKLLAQVSKTHSLTPAAASSSRSHTPKGSRAGSTPGRPSTPAPVLGRINMAGAPGSPSVRSDRPPSPRDATSEEDFDGLADDDVAITCASVTRDWKATKE